MRADNAQTDVAADITALRTLLVASNAANFQADLTAVNSFVGGSGPTDTRIADTVNIIGLFDPDLSAYPSAVTGTSTLRGRVTDISSALGMGNASIAADLAELNGTTGLSGTSETSTQARITEIMAILGDFADNSTFPNTLSTEDSIAGRVQDVHNVLGFGAGSISQHLTTLSSGRLGGNDDESLNVRSGVPASGTTGLASVIRNNTAATNATGSTNFNTAFTAYNNAAALKEQVSAFLAVFDVAGAQGGLRIPDGTYPSLSALLCAAVDNGVG